jgi:membrane fusion protein (multidrug efflux system)
VVTVQPAAVALQQELPGRVEALRTAQVRARVSGVVTQRLFQEGSDVRAGQPLYRIDAAPYQAALDSAQATLQRAEAVLAQARQTLQRYEPLADSKVISQQDLSNARSAQRMAEAEAAAARAAVQTARINLGYANVVAPISGRIGRALVSEGALVTAGEATPMALIQQVSSVYVNFTQSSAELLRLRRMTADGARQRIPSDAVAVRIVLDDGTELPQAGRLLFSDISVDPGSAQVTLRAEVPNPQGLLLPGQYVRVRLAQATLGGAALLPQQAVTRSGSGDTVLVVGEGNKPVTRRVQVSGSQGANWVVTSGLQSGDRVIVDGFQKIQAPGSPVIPVPARWPPPPWRPCAFGTSQPLRPGAAGWPTSSSTARSSPG